MPRFDIILTASADRRLVVDAPDAETACDMAEAAMLRGLTALAAADVTDVAATSDGLTDAPADLVAEAPRPVLRLTESEAEAAYRIGTRRYEPNDPLDMPVVTAHAALRRVWTMVSGDDGLCLLPGVHYVNREYYLLAEIPLPADVEIEIVPDPAEESESGDYAPDDVLMHLLVEAGDSFPADVALVATNAAAIASEWPVWKNGEGIRRCGPDAWDRVADLARLLAIVECSPEWDDRDGWDDRNVGAGDFESVAAKLADILAHVGEGEPFDAVRTLHAVLTATAPHGRTF